MPSDDSSAYDMADDLEKIAHLVSMVAYKYFNSPPDDLSWAKWRTNAVRWLESFNDEFPLQGLADVIEELLNEAFLAPVDYEIPEADLEGVDVVVDESGDVHSVDAPQRGNLGKSTPKYTLLKHPSGLLCDFCQFESADRWVPHLDAHFCGTCYWRNTDLTLQENTSDAATYRVPPVRDDKEDPCLFTNNGSGHPRPDPGGEHRGTPKPDTRSWAGFPFVPSSEPSTT